MSAIKISEVKDSLIIWGKQHKSESSITKENLLYLFANISLYKYIGGQEDNIKLIKRVVNFENLSQQSKKDIETNLKQYIFVGIIMLIKYNSSNIKEFTEQLNKKLGITIKHTQYISESYKEFTTSVIETYINKLNYKQAYNQEYKSILMYLADNYI